MPITACSSAAHAAVVSAAGVSGPSPSAEPVQFHAQPDQVLMGIRQATANQVRSLEPSLETAGPACQIGAFPEPGCWALAGSGGVWQAWPVPGIRSVDQGA